MDELPPNKWPKLKLPKDYTGQGIEFIGDPNELFSEGVSLYFQDGDFVSLVLPTRSLVLPADPNLPPERQSPERRASIRRYNAKALAETFQKDSSDINAKKGLKVIRKACREALPNEDRATNNDVKKILSGDLSPNWSYQDRREKVAVAAIVELARELKRPPYEWELTDRMKAMSESINGREVKILQGKDDQNLSRFLRKSGFSWLERWPRGCHRGR
jgi:hypothetical protein